MKCWEITEWRKKKRMGLCIKGPDQKVGSDDARRNRRLGQKVTWPAVVGGQDGEKEGEIQGRDSEARNESRFLSKRRRRTWWAAQGHLSMENSEWKQSRFQITECYEKARQEFDVGSEG